MQLRPLGRSGLSIAPLAFGGNVFGWTADEAMSFRLLDAFVDAGSNLIDTADVYSRWVPGHVGGESEAIIERWLKASGKRDRVLIATKVGKPRIGFSNALFRPFSFPMAPRTRQNTAPGALESVFGGGCGLLGVDSAAENRPSRAPSAGYPLSSGRFHRSGKPSDAADSSGPVRRVA